MVKSKIVMHAQADLVQCDGRALGQILQQVGDKGDR